MKHEMKISEKVKFVYDSSVQLTSLMLKNKNIPKCWLLARAKNFLLRKKYNVEFFREVAKKCFLMAGGEGKGPGIKEKALMAK